MKILVTFAVDAEFAPWRDLRAFAKSVVEAKSVALKAEYPVYATSLDSSELRVALTGMGCGNAKRAIGTLLDAWPPDFCISSGLAGATKAEHGIGEILVAESVGPLRRDRSQISDPKLLNLACAHGAKRVGAFLSSAHFVKSASEKQLMSGFVDAVEMESFPILCGALGRRIPTVAIRVISDASAEDMPYDFDLFVDERGWPSVPRALKQLAKHPGGVRRLASVVRRANKSAEILADFFERFIPALISAQDVVLSGSAASIS